MHLLLSIWASLLFQTAPAVQPTASFSGTVVDALSLQPIPGASVQLSIGGTAPISEVTSADGSFRFGALRPGSYNTTIIASGYVQGRSPLGGMELTANQSKANVRIELTPMGSISGRILEASNDPAANLTVQALKLEDLNGKREWRVVESRPTDDLGEYRLFWLEPGSYFIRAVRSDSLETVVHSPFRSIETNDAPSWSTPTRVRKVLDDGTTRDEATFPVYYPGTIYSGLAMSIDVRPGQDFTGADFQFAAIPVHRIQGRIVGINGRPELSSSIRAVPLNTSSAGSPDFDFSIFGAELDADRRFEMTGFPSGTYLLLAETRVDGKLWSGRFPVEVGNKDISDVTIALTRNETVIGRFSINGARYEAPAVEIFADIRLVSSLADSEYVDGVSDKAVVRFSDVPIGDYRVQVMDRIEFRTPGITAAAPAYIESIRSGAQDALQNGVNLTDDPNQTLDISLRTDFANVLGRAVGIKPEESQFISVALVPEFRDDLTRYRTTLTDPTGQFKFSGVAPGNYKLFARSAAPNGAERNIQAFSQSDLLQFESRGIPVSIKPGDNEVVDVPVLNGTPGASRP
jgi:hypothetical protein